MVSALSWRMAKRVVTLVVGGTVVLIGLALIVLPGPAFVVIPAGLAILATEFVWAARLLERVKREAKRGAKAIGFPVKADRQCCDQPPPEAQREDPCAPTDQNSRK